MRYAKMLIDSALTLQFWCSIISSKTGRTDCDRVSMPSV